MAYVRKLGVKGGTHIPIIIGTFLSGMDRVQDSMAREAAEVVQRTVPLCRNRIGDMLFRLWGPCVLVNRGEGGYAKVQRSALNKGGTLDPVLARNGSASNKEHSTCGRACATMHKRPPIIAVLSILSPFSLLCTHDVNGIRGPA